MLDPQKISIGRVQKAYDLNENDVENMIQALWPTSIFPVELWHRAHEKFWRTFADSNHAIYEIESPTLPEVDTTKKFFHTHLCSIDVMNFFRKLSLSIEVNILRKGLNFILEEVYENIDDVFLEEREFLFNTLSRLETVDIFKQYSPNSELFEEKILSLPISSYHFVSHIFQNTMLVDKAAAICHLRNYPLCHEVKGITHALVASVLNSPSVEIAIPFEIPTLPINYSDEGQPQEQEIVFRVPASLWEGKSDPSARDAMIEAQYPLEVIAYVLVNWCGVDEAQSPHKTPKGRKTYIGSLLSKESYTDPKSYRNFINPLLEKANAYTIIKA